MSKVGTTTILHLKSPPSRPNVGRKKRKKRGRATRRAAPGSDNVYMSRFLLAPTLAVGAWSPTLTAWSLPIGGSSGAGGFVGEAWGKVGNVQALRERLTVRGNNRLYAVAEMPSKERPKWSDFSYLRLPLLNRRLAFEVDLSAVGCGCNAAVYLVAASRCSTRPSHALCQ